MKKIIIILAAVLIGMEGLGWWVYKKSKQGAEIPEKASQQEISSPQTAVANKQKNTPEQKNTSTNEQTVPNNSTQETPSPQATTANGRNVLEQKDVSSDQIVADASGILAGFPEPSVERVGNVDERTIHMGVRQWEWVPIQLTAKEGEKVRLVMHNADVLHSIAIKEFNVNAYIPEEGAVVEFMANRKGTFEFFCNTPCGKDHNKMRGKIIIS